jgi:hypothetical protein
MKTIERSLFSFYGAALIILSFCMLYILLGSGHGLHLHDNSQMLLAGEIFIILLTGIAILSKNKNFIFGRRAMIVLLILSETALIDVFIELRNGEAETVIIVLIMLVLLMILNLVALVILLKNR